MTEMVERVARAIREVRNIDPQTAHDFACAAIAAMREPTDAMLDALLPGCNQEWAAAIDAALAESLPAATNNG